MVDFFRHFLTNKDEAEHMSVYHDIIRSLFIRKDCIITGGTRRYKSDPEITLTDSYLPVLAGASASLSRRERERKKGRDENRNKKMGCYA